LIGAPFCTNKSAWDQFVVLSKEAISQPQFWTSHFNQFNGTHPMWRPSHVHSVNFTQSSTLMLLAGLPAVLVVGVPGLHMLPMLQTRTELVYLS
jgi:hypothetical protein